MSKVTITIEGEVGSGKSAILGRIAQMMEYLDIPVTYANPEEARIERENTRDNWQGELEMYQPSVHLVERIAEPKTTSVPTVNELFDLRSKKTEQAKLDLEAEIRRDLAKRKFMDHLKKTSEIVDSWPEWKKNWKP